jgi:hypothetical protein
MMLTYTNAQAPALIGASRRALLIGSFAAVLLLVTLVFFPVPFLRGYLAAFVVWSAVPLGSASILMTHHLATGRWGKALRPSLESAVATMPLLPAFFLPILIGARWLYPWADPARVAADPILQHQHPYLNLPFFVIRAICYFVIWTAGAHLLTHWSSQRDPESDVPPHRLQTLSAVGLLIYALTISFAAIDWLASLEPHWYSSVFGLYILISQALAGLAVLVVFVVTLSRRPLASDPDRAVENAPVPSSILHDFGNLLFLLVILHTYLSFAQYFIIWNGNLPNESSWYVARIRGAWGELASLIVIVNFVLPFTLLLFRFFKRTPQFLVFIACIILAARVIEAPWLVFPSFQVTTPLPFAIAALAMAALGGFWIAAFARQWSRAPLAYMTPDT